MVPEVVFLQICDCVSYRCHSEKNPSVVTQGGSTAWYVVLHTLDYLAMKKKSQKETEVRG